MLKQVYRGGCLGEGWLGQLAGLCLVSMAGESPFYLFIGAFSPSGGQLQWLMFHSLWRLMASAQLQFPRPWPFGAELDQEGKYEGQAAERMGSPGFTVVPPHPGCPQEPLVCTWVWSGGWCPRLELEKLWRRPKSDPRGPGWAGLLPGLSYPLAAE